MRRIRFRRPLLSLTAVAIATFGLVAAFPEPVIAEADPLSVTAVQQGQWHRITRTATPATVLPGGEVTYRTTIDNDPGAFLVGIAEIRDVQSTRLEYVMGSAKATRTLKGQDEEILELINPEQYPQNTENSRSYFNFGNYKVPGSEEINSSYSAIKGSSFTFEVTYRVPLEISGQFLQSGISYRGVSTFTDFIDIGPSVAVGAKPRTCAAVNYLAVRGSNEAPQGAMPSEATYAPEVINKGMGEPLENQFDILKTMLDSLDRGRDLLGRGVVYRAIPVPDYALDGPAYLLSLKEGAINLRQALHDINSGCAGQETKIVLTGYSQGADVINTAAAEAQREGNRDDFKNVTSIVYYGNPSRIGGQVREVDDQTGTGIRRLGGAAVDPETDTWINDPDHRPLFISFCAEFDTVCDNADNLTLAAAKVVVGGVLGGTSHAVFGAAAASALGIKQHTSYQKSQVVCPSDVQNRRITATQCGATMILNELGYTVPSQYFPAPPPFVAPDLATSIVVKINDKNKTLNFHAQSDPVYLGTATTDDDGVAVLNVVLPESLPDGEHHIVVSPADGVGPNYSVPVSLSRSAQGTAEQMLTITERDLDENRVTPPGPTTTPTTPPTTTPPTAGGAGSSGSTGFGS